MRYLAILKDSLVEALDRKSLYVMMALSGLFVLLCASLSYSPMDERAAIQDMADQFDSIVNIRGFGITGAQYDVRFDVGAIRPLGADEGRFKDGYGFALTVSGSADEWRKLVRHWDAVRRGAVKKKDDPIPDVDKDPDAELQEKFVRDRFREKMVPTVEARTTGDRVFAVKMKPVSRELLEGAYRGHFLFGLWSFKLPMSVAMFVFVLESLLSEYLAGWIGCGIALVFTAGFVPSMLQRGSLDVLLARPLRRWTLLLLKYLGGLTYATISATVFLGGSWLALSARSGVWNWGYLATIGTLVFFFAVLYSIGVFFAVLTRSWLAAMVMPVVVWALASGVNNAQVVLNHPEFKAEVRVPGIVTTALDVVHFVLPKPKDFNIINQYLMAKGSFGEAMEGMRAEIPEIAWLKVVLTSLGLIAVTLSLSCWIFTRRDY